MNFIDAVLLAKEGKKIRQVNWNKGDYINIINNRIIWAPNNSAYYIMDKSSTLIDWEIYEEVDNEYYRSKNTCLSM